MGKTIIYFLMSLFLISVVIAVNYDYIYNPYTAKLDRSLKLNQSGSDLIVDTLLVESPPLECSSGSFLTYTNMTNVICKSATGSSGNSTWWLELWDSVSGALWGTANETKFTRENVTEYLGANGSLLRTENMSDIHESSWKIENGTGLPFSNFVLENVSNSTPYLQVTNHPAYSNFKLENVSNSTPYLQITGHPDYSNFNLENVSNSTPYLQITNHPAFSNFNYANISEWLGVGNASILRVGNLSTINTLTNYIRTSDFNIKNISNSTPYLQITNHPPYSNFNLENVSNTTYISAISDNNLLRRTADFTIENISNVTPYSQITGLPDTTDLDIANVSMLDNNSIVRMNTGENGSLYQPVYGTDDDLVLYLPFSEDSVDTSTQFDRSPYGNDATLNGVICNSTSANQSTSRYGGACYFDGVDDNAEAISITDPGTFALDLDGSMTLSGWFKFNTVATAGLITKRNSGGNQINYMLRYTTQINFIIRNKAGTNQEFNVAWSPVAGRWYYVVATYNEFTKDVGVYVDGERISTSTAVGSPQTDDNPVRIGNDDGTSGYFDGSADEIMIYKRALTAEEIRTHYLRGSGFGASGAITADKFRVVNTSGSKIFEVNTSGVGIYGTTDFQSNTVYAHDIRNNDNNPIIIRGNSKSGNGFKVHTSGASPGYADTARLTISSAVATATATWSDTNVVFDDWIYLTDDNGEGIRHQSTSNYFGIFTDRTDDTTDGIIFFSKNAAGADTARLKIGSGADTVAATWSGIEHTNMAMSSGAYVTSGTGAANTLFTIQQTTVAGWRIGMTSGSSTLKFDTGGDTFPNPELEITSAGNVGIGTTNPSVALDVTGDIEYTGTISDVSDERLKENIADITNALDTITALRGITFNMLNATNVEYGLIAQEVQSIVPEAVSITDENGYLGISYLSFTPILIEAIKEQQTQIESLKSEYKICFNSNCSNYICRNQSNGIMMIINEAPDEVCM
ncbi:MAG: hypothetical protein CMH64_01715 [Nanoarchaeota archaeon]|nr:hypothetical protein [Nanoarchaeota archaeon]